MGDAIVPARGFRDVLPAEKAKREAVLASIRSSYSRFGFTEIETPAVEPIERLSSNQGGENEKLVFRIMKRGIDPNEMVRVGDAADLGLRYDLTVPLVRYYASHRHELPAVFRSLQIGPVWRAERPQKGRYRQFLQCDIDTLGDASTLVEIELITATLYALAELGITDATVRLNDRRVLDSLLGSFGFAPESRGKALIIIDKLDKVGVSGVCDQLTAAEFGTESVEKVRGLLEAFATIEDGHVGKVAAVLPADIDEAGLAAVREIASAVTSAREGVRVVFDPTLVRGMGYYTGPIFEVAHPSSSSSIAGGGRYDAMGEQLFGIKVPACGFSIGFERIMGLVDDARFSHGEPVLAIVYKDTPPVTLARLQCGYVAEGRRVVLAKRAKNLAKQLTDLGNQGATHFCLLEGDVASAEEIEERALER